MKNVTEIYQFSTKNTTIYIKGILYLRRKCSHKSLQCIDTDFNLNTFDNFF